MVADPERVVRLIEQPLCIGGAWRAATGAPIRVLDPALEEPLADVPSATAAEVHAALECARTAQAGWARSSTVERGVHLRAIADLVAVHRGSLAALLVKEVGKPASQAAGEREYTESLLRYSAEWDRRLEGEILPGEGPGEVIHLLRAPVGVVAAICSWNFPLAVLARRLAPALLAGNTLVVKASEVTPLSTMELFRLIDEHLDLPPGVVNLVTGWAIHGRLLQRRIRLSVDEQRTTLALVLETADEVLGPALHGSKTQHTDVRPSARSRCVHPDGAVRRSAGRPALCSSSAPAGRLSLPLRRPRTVASGACRSSRSHGVGDRAGDVASLPSTKSERRRGVADGGPA